MLLKDSDVREIAQISELRKLDELITRLEIELFVVDSLYTGEALHY